jgi:hypothetical protein
MALTEGCVVAVPCYNGAGRVQAQCFSEFLAQDHWSISSSSTMVRKYNQFIAWLHRVLCAYLLYLP